MPRIKVDCTGCKQYVPFGRGICRIGNIDGWAREHGILDRYFVFCCRNNESLLQLVIENASLSDWGDSIV